ncbi:hypothetical protein CHLRE_02g144734v5 [Chlamydomonas reinhardtii]|uniref:Uncharacterized protein n=1 Tax=Chlamydomonas reinhardtii TaxID=3055 RepID=A0A2K3E3U0_CHLRE|nr:uncharacterized protein CHLRE_02g144734v5 [Chlamydomonas reinhardtii]PNW87460.1 hypothetical protein CHLRE_02g144734v5 [Chlamydomonas reinhardtii]
MISPALQSIHNLKTDTARWMPVMNATFPGQLYGDAQATSTTSSIVTAAQCHHRFNRSTPCQPARQTVLRRTDKPCGADPLH